MSGLRLNRNILGGAALTAALLAGASVPAATSAQAGPARASDLLQLGRNANGEACTAAITWTDPVQKGFTKFRDVYSVTCSGAVTGTLARVRMFPSAAARAAASEGLTCGEPSSVALAGFDNATARRCFDPALGFGTVVIDADARGGRAVQISAAPSAVGAGYQAALMLTGQGGADQSATAGTPVEIASLAALPANLAAAQAEAGPREDVDAVLARATSLNFRGLSADASRFLRNELTRLPADTSATKRAKLLLEAGLADSNIRFFRSAQANIDAAAAEIRRADAIDRRDLQTRLATYRGLHALNQRDFAGARQILTPLAEQTRARVSGLDDPAALVQLNNMGGDKTDPRAAIAQPNLEFARDTVVRVQGNWALSVSELTLGNRASALNAIGLARRELDNLKQSLTGQRVKLDGLNWLDARLVRQEGRVKAESGDFAGAIAAFDEAIGMLLPARGERAFSATDPAVAEIQLERAAIIARSGRPAAEVEAAYGAALDTMLAAREESGGFSTALLHPYLDRLADRMANGDKAAASRYFSALQVAGESSAARQVNQLQEIVSSDPAIAGKLRERLELQRRLSELPVAIDDARRLGEPVAALEQELSQAQEAYFAVEADLAANARLSQVSDKPADLAALQAKLNPGEAYVRLTVMNDRVFGMLVERDRTFALRPQLSADDLLEMANQLRRSVDYDLDNERIPGFQVGTSRLLYSVLFGSVDAELRRNTELVVDGGRLFSGITAGLLVTDRASEERFAKQEDKSDYSQVAFLAKEMSTSVAISPRSFIASRDFAPSRARRTLLGMAAPVGLRDQKIGTDGTFRVGPCRVNADRFARSINRLDPIPATEITEVASALGLAGSPALISGASFSDSEVQRRGAAGGELGDYKILHFATHGLTEGMFDCAEFPAGLLTSLGGSSDSDLMLSYEEIAGLRLDANLVVMSACETASLVGEGTQLRAGEARPGDTLDGLVRSFFAAGTRAVMATYWETSNSGKSEKFMAAFYGAGRDRSIAQAANAAQQAMLADPATSHPFYWAGFFVVGQTNNQMLAGGASQVAAR
jgi:CHAT domain-containing protein